VRRHRRRNAQDGEQTRDRTQQPGEPFHAGQWYRRQAGHGSTTEKPVFWRRQTLPRAYTLGRLPRLHEGEAAMPREM